MAFAQEVDMPAPDADKGAELYTNGDMSRGIIACVTCHGEAGNSTLSDNPVLAGMPHEYIVKQLIDFVKPEDKDRAARLGEGGADSLMTPFAAALNEEDRSNLALYLAQQSPDLDNAPTATNEDTMERGQHIWRGGLPDRNVPACASCHGANGMGMPAEYPRLAGQFPEYIEQQLKLFRSGDRDNSSMMFDIADRMSDSDIAAVSDYAAGLR
ncbi:MAG TPA: c-type cytochrome [Burkholderiaceae bacterium]|nr:c-type cytochrome [Burkholderiaceae bacterium]